MSEESRLVPETNDSEGLLNVSGRRLEELLSGQGDALDNAVRRAREEAQNGESYAAFGNTP